MKLISQQRINNYINNTNNYYSLNNYKSIINKSICIIGDNSNVDNNIYQQYDREL